MRLRTIIGVDFGQASVTAASWVARWLLPDSPLALAYGVRLREEDPPGLLPAAEREALLQRAREEGRNALGPLLLECDPSRTEALVGTGAPADALLSLVDDWGAELIVVGPHSQSELLTGFFGSTASRLLLLSRVPVLVVREADAGAPQRILVAIDGREGTDAVLETALEIAAKHDCSVRAFYTVDEELGAEEAPSPTEPRPEAEHVLEEALSRVDAPRDGLEIVIGSGSAGEAICRAAADGINLIVMGTRGPVPGTSVLESAARFVVSHAPCPVLVIPSLAA
ncbi:MAG: universal stress protein [Gemmatimonadetes bacterium]|nr:universal stress protein [Gemmatimonadota bacterium]NNM32397.1 universal stress protein [Gemmatimonadota bacterium]